MPKDKHDAADPDPTEFLFVSVEQKRQDQCKPYDAKKSCWVPVDKGGFVLGEIRAAKGDQITVCVNNKELIFKKEQVSQVNPPKFEKCEDMSNLTYLNDASVLWNLKDRYISKLIYTYSGLFLVSVNPYERFPIYTERVVRMYRGKRKTEMPPHIFAVSDGAYRDMLNNRDNQSMLITGESGAGKTENTKKVISYFATVGANEYKGDQGRKGNLEDQVVQTNPVLEAFGNAKTIRNDNSSRFGKFIRIHFNELGKLAGADIETYLLEKARVISQQPMERSYHIFYQIMSGSIAGLKEKLLLSDNFQDYPNQSMGKIKIEGLDDKEEMEITDNCMDVLGFSGPEKENVYRTVAAVMHLGTMKFKQRGREEQAEADGTHEGEVVAKLLGIEKDDFYLNLLKPRIKVGNEMVTQGRTRDQIYFSIGALCKAIYDKLFTWLVQKCNDTLVSEQTKDHFIGVLDIAGFEIFELNSFEQLCINFTNEKLQQFFNHHMFVLEQEEYQREGIQWTFIDFGMDLQPCIDLIEKPLGIFSILEEESMFPKASDKTFEEKLKNNHLGKTANFTTPKSTGGKESKEAASKAAHFAVVHYAGTVGYNVSGWLEKNKDPLNDTVIEQLRKASNPLIVDMFPDSSGAEAPGEKRFKRAKGSTFQTVSALYRGQVENLMAILRATAPHFIRCIIPNENKKAGELDAKLVLHQLNCNGVLEGIRICRKGFPNRMSYKEFKERYMILDAKEMSEAGEKQAAALCFNHLGLEEDKYRLGHTKVFLRAGILGFMEERRDERIRALVSALQSQCRCYLSQKQFKILLDQRRALLVLQRVIRMYMNLRFWLWWKLWMALKPSLQVGTAEDRIRKLEAKLKLQQEEKALEEQKAREREAELERAKEVQEQAQKELEKQKAMLEELEQLETKWRQEAMKRQKEAQDAQDLLEKEEEARLALEEAKNLAEAQIKDMKRNIQNLESAFKKAEQDKACKDHQIRSLNEEIQNQEQSLMKMSKERKMLQEAQQKLSEELLICEDKNAHLTKVKNKLEATLGEMEEALENEKRNRAEQEKQRRKLESDLKSAQASIEAAERNKKEADLALSRKDKDLANMAEKLDQEQAQVVKAQRHIKDLNMRLDDMQDELESEKTFRVKAENERLNMRRELQELQDRLEEAGGLTSAQMELNKKREAEMHRLKHALDEASVQHEATLANIRKKHADNIQQLSDQIDAQSRLRQKLEKDKMAAQSEAQQMRLAADQTAAEKTEMERELKATLTTLNHVQSELDEAKRNAQDLDAGKRKAQEESAELSRHLEAAEFQVSQLSSLRASLESKLNDAQKFAEDEAKEKAQLLNKCRLLERERDTLRQNVDEENDARSELQRQCNKLSSEMALWKSKYEKESLVRIEDLENALSKLQLRLAEADETIQALTSRCSYLEKTKQKLLTEIEDTQLQLEQTQHLAIQLQKSASNFDKVIGEWKQKADELTEQLEQSQKDNRESLSEVFRLRAALESTKDQLDCSQRDNKNLSLEVKDLLDQISDEGRSLYEVEKQCRRLEDEKEEMAAAMEEAEASLEQEENRCLRYQLELSQMKQEMEQRLKEKDDDLEKSRKGFQRILDSVQASLDNEGRAKAEALRAKKKLEEDLQEMERNLDHMGRDQAELQKTIKQSQTNQRELEQTIEQNGLENEALKESISLLERKSHVLANELEETNTYLEQAERGRKQAEMELDEMKEQNGQLVASHQTLLNVRRNLEAELVALRAELQEAFIDIKNSEEKVKKAVSDAIKLAEDLRLEQERGKREEQSHKMAQAHIKELQIRLDEAEANSIRGGRRLIEKLEAKIRSLSCDVENEHRWKTDLMKNYRRAERKLKESEFHLEEERRNYEKLHELSEKMQAKIKSYKMQLEDAEEIAALNLAKLRKAQAELEEAEQRANLCEQALNNFKARSSIGPP